MDDTNIIAISGRDAVTDPLTDLLRKGARELLQAAVEAERDAFLAEFAERRTPDGRAAVVRSGYHPERAVQTGIGPVTVKVPKVRAKDGKPVTFRSALVPPYVRKAKSIEAALPWLYLKGISTGEMGSALKMLLGSDANGFSAKTISRLKGQWAVEYNDWRRADLGRDEWVYVWADGIYSGLRGTDDRLCVLVVIGVNARGEKHFLAIEDGVRESTQSWREVLLSLKSRGLNAPKLATGDGAMGFWAALEEVFPTTGQQRCCPLIETTFRLPGNRCTRPVMCSITCPSAPSPRPRRCCMTFTDRQGISARNVPRGWQAETREDAHAAFDLFIDTFEAKYPKAAECLIKDRAELLTFYDFPAQHWQSIRTSNPIESVFATIRHRTKRTKGCLSRDGMLHIPLVTFLRNALPGSGCSNSANALRKAGASCAALPTSPTSSRASISSTTSSHQTKIKPPHEEPLDTRFDNNSRQHELALALREIGKVERTLFIIEWLLDADIQRRAQIGLNKGEAHHALKNALRIGRQGEIRDRTAEGQHYRMAGLNLLAAIIIYWNTKHLGYAVIQLQRSKLDCPPELLAHISPLGWAHILLTGEYRWRKQQARAA